MEVTLKVKIRKSSGPKLIDEEISDLVNDFARQIQEIDMLYAVGGPDGDEDVEYEITDVTVENY